MEDNRLLYNAFNIYYEKGMDALKAKKYEVAKRNLLAASETLLKLAKSSNGELKAQRMKRADELYDLADKIEGKQYQSRNAQTAVNDLNILGGNPREEKKYDKQNEEEKRTTFTPVGKTNISLDDVAGLDEAKEEIRKLIIEPRLHPDIYKRFNKTKGGGVLLYGVPGTGKTMLAKAIANEIDAAFYSVKCSDIASKWFGEAEQNVKNLFAEARKQKNAIIFFDEFEALGTKRDTYSTVMKRLVPELLAQMQGFDNSENTLLLIAATNRPWDIDSAFLRPGRFNTQIYVPLPDDKAREVIVKKQFDNIPVTDDFKISNIVELTKGFNGSDVVYFCDKAKDYAITRSIENGNLSEVNNEDINQTSKRVHTSAKLEDIQHMVKYQQESAMSR